MSLPKSYSAEEVAAFLHKSERWVVTRARGYRDPQLPHMKVGKDYVFTEDHLNQIVEMFRARTKPIVRQTIGVKPRTRKKTAA